MTPLILGAITLLAQTVETIAGFGSTIIALALGIHFIPLTEWVATLVIIGWLQSLWLVTRGWHHIQWRILFTRILPGCAIGLPTGIWLQNQLNPNALKYLLGIFVIFAALLELIRMRKATARPLHPALGHAIVAGGGFFHGMFASGGPMIVYFTSRVITAKSAFRATLSVLWLILNSILLITYTASGRINSPILTRAAFLLPALALGILAGEYLHHRLNEKIFRTIVYVLLLLTGIALLS